MTLVLTRFRSAGPPLHTFMMSFTDGRDAGLLLVSHFSLLTGCAVSVWLALSLQPPGASRNGKHILFRRPRRGSSPSSAGCQRGWYIDAALFVLHIRSGHN